MSFGSQIMLKICSQREDFSQALYSFDIGQNDIYHALTSMGEVEARKSIPELMNQFALAIKVIFLAIMAI